MKRISAILLLQLFVLGALDLHAEERSSTLPFRYLRSETSSGFTELEFFPDGRLLQYDYMDDFSESGDEVPLAQFQPRFAVRSLRWKLDGQSLTIQRGDDRDILTGKMSDAGLHWHLVFWKSIERLEFFEKLNSYCGKKESVSQR